MAADNALRKPSVIILSSSPPQATPNAIEAIRTGDSVLAQGFLRKEAIDNLARGGADLSDELCVDVVSFRLKTLVKCE